MDAVENGQKPACPIITIDAKGTSQWAAGLTKREAFAMAALQGMLSASEWTPGFAAQKAVEQADALLVALAKGD